MTRDEWHHAAATRQQSAIQYDKGSIIFLRHGNPVLDLPVRRGGSLYLWPPAFHSRAVRNSTARCFTRRRAGRPAGGRSERTAAAGRNRGAGATVALRSFRGPGRLEG
jgi:hypothetical protein